MGKNRKTAAAIAAAALIAAAVLHAADPLVKYRNMQLKDAVTGVREESCAVLEDMIPFEWDAAYTFPPYTSREEIERSIGVRSRSICETVSEGMVQLIFVDDAKVVASVCGYRDSLGYDVVFDSSVEFGQRTEFEVDASSGAVILTAE